MKTNTDLLRYWLFCSCCRWPQTSRFALVFVHSFDNFERKTWYSLPLTVRETSFSPAPTRGTTARQTYFPASSCLTDFSVRRFSLLRTCSKKKSKIIRCNDSKGIFAFEIATRQRRGEKRKVAPGPFYTLKGTSPQLLKSNLGSELSRKKGLALAFDVEKRKGGMSLNLGSNQ